MTEPSPLGVVDYYVLDDHGVPVPAGDVREWDRWLVANVRARLVASTAVDDHVKVVTVFVGLDRRFGEPGPPLIFDTGVFGGPSGGSEWHWSTCAEAAAGHDRVVAALREGVAPADRLGRVS